MILTVCTGNTCRSPMARALLQRALDARGIRETVQSAGLMADGSPASQGSVDAMREWGIDLSAHRSRQLTAALCDEATRIYVMTPAHARVLVDALGVAPHKVFVLGDGIPDPFGGDAALYTATRDAIEQAVQTAVQHIADTNNFCETQKSD